MSAFCNFGKALIFFNQMWFLPWLPHATQGQS